MRRSILKIMAASVLVPLSEYLQTMYHPDCDFVDGEVQERNLGEVPHSGLQAFFTTVFSIHRKTWGVRALPEQRVQVSKSRFRIPDICVLKLGASPDPIVRTPPLLCIEILSPEDTFSRTQERIADYNLMGVEHVWLIDPLRRRIWVTEARNLRELEGDALMIPGTPIRIAVADILAELDDLQAGRL